MYNDYERYIKLKESLNSVQISLVASMQAVLGAHVVTLEPAQVSCPDNDKQRKRTEDDHHKDTSILSRKKQRLAPKQLNFSTTCGQSPAVGSC